MTGVCCSPKESARAGEYKRHLITESGISPRALPLQGKALVVTDSDEHDEAGHLIEDAETRTAMMQKRTAQDGRLEERDSPQGLRCSKPELTLVGWGSTYGAIKEAVDLAMKDGWRSTLYTSPSFGPSRRSGRPGAAGSTRRIIALRTTPPVSWPTCFAQRPATR